MTNFDCFILALRNDLMLRIHKQHVSVRMDLFSHNNLMCLLDRLDPEMPGHRQDNLAVGDYTDALEYIKEVAGNRYAE